MENDPDKDYGKKERRKQQHAARKAGRSEFVQALAAELEGAPEEVCCLAQTSRLCLPDATVVKHQGFAFLNLQWSNIRALPS